MIATETKKWIETFIKQDEIDKYLDNGRDLIDDAALAEIILSTGPADARQVRDILDKSLAIEALTPEETAVLANVNDPDIIAEMENAAGIIKKKVYDNRIVTFAPLYLGNKCVNNCLYCGFRSSNDQSQRRVLTLEEVKREAEVLAGKIGHKRLIVVYGESPETDVDFMVDSIKAIYSVKVKTKHGHSEIRRVNVNAAPMSIEELRKLKAAGLGTYQVFQETYHHETYSKLHPKNTLKGNYPWRLYAMHRAFEAGIDDVGIGVLFGLHDWKFELLGLVRHAAELEKKFGIGPHTISFPRLEQADNTPYVRKAFQNVTDEDFKRIITIIRLAVPYTGMIITARETAQMRTTAIKLGITQLDASSRVGIGAYSDPNDAQQGDKQQFYLGDTRSLDQVIGEFAELGYIVSFCTAGYRCGRTGKKIMKLLRTGTEGKYCKLNAVLTYREWLDDFASEATKLAGEKVIANEIAEIKEKMPTYYPGFIKHYERIQQGERDICI